MALTCVLPESASSDCFSSFLGAFFSLAGLVGVVDLGGAFNTTLSLGIARFKAKDTGY